MKSYTIMIRPGVYRRVVRRDRRLPGRRNRSAPVMRAVENGPIPFDALPLELRQPSGKDRSAGAVVEERTDPLFGLADPIDRSYRNGR